MKHYSSHSDNCIINPTREPGEKEVAHTGILACNPTDAGYFQEMASSLGLTPRYLFHSRLYAGDNLFLAGPAVGAPMAVLCLEKLIALGAQHIIVYGWCGSLQENLHAMDVLVPTSGLSEEGTSRHYQTYPRCGITPSGYLRDQICYVLSKNNIQFKQGSVWTTDAPYRETRKKIIDYAAEGILGVDMEYSALCTVAAFRKVKLAAVMLVSDEIHQSPWKPHYSFKSFKRRSKEILALLCEIAKTENAS